jgi:MoxR-like ATPase
MDEQRIAAIVDQRINHALAGIPSLRIEVKGGDGVTREVEGHQHPKFKQLLMACTARRVGNRPLNVWISGPAASGKTYAAQQVAKAMGLKFYFHASVTASFEVLGWKDAGGTYHRTHFRDAFEHGGVILLDEVDGWDANATMALNAALENGLCAFPDAIVERHADCIVIAAGNTWGLGATADYVGRNKLDGAFLDRFHVRLDWQYDVALEIAISGNEKWTRRVQAARERARAAGLKVLITPRASQAGAALIEAGMTMDEAAELTYLANLTKEQRKMVEGA